MIVKVGVVGLGAMGSIHLDNLNTISNAQVIAVCDADKDRSEQVAREFRVKSFWKLEEMLEENLDAVYICVPPHAHQNYELKIVKRDCALFVEKPLGLKLDTTEEIAQAVKKQRVINCVGYHWRCLDIVDRAKELLKGKKISLVHGYWYGGFPTVEWWRKKTGSGGQIIEQTTHVFDLIRYLTGEVKSVSSRGFKGLMTDYNHYDIEDASTVHLDFVDGKIGCICSNCLAPKGFSKAGAEMVGRDFLIQIILPAAFDVVDIGSMSLSTPGEKISWKVEKNPYYTEDELFIEAVATKNQNLIRSSYEDALKTFKLTLAAQESIDNHQTITLF